MTTYLNQIRFGINYFITYFFNKINVNELLTKSEYTDDEMYIVGLFIVILFYLIYKVLDVFHQLLSIKL